MTAKLFGKYQLLKKIGTGGMAELFLARQAGIEGFEKLLVIKRILPHLAEAEQFIEMFLDEARLAAQLNHPNIVQIYDLGRVAGQYFIAMEYVNGVDLSRILKREHKRDGKVPITHAVKITSYVCEALAYAHARNDSRGRSLKLVHRDVSPQNVLVAFEGGVKLTDFGIAKASSRAAETKTGSLKGKYAYMSPEQCLGKGIDHRSDIFSVGILLYQLTTGTLPFTGESEFSAMNSIVNEPHPAPDLVREDIPASLVGILGKALAKKPEDRFPDSLAFQMSLEHVLMEEKAVSNTALIGQYVRDLFKDVVEVQASSRSDGSVTIEGILTSLALTPTGQKVEEQKTRIREEAGRAAGGALADRPTHLFETGSQEHPARTWRTASILFAAVLVSGLLGALGVHWFGRHRGDGEQAPSGPQRLPAVAVAPPRIDGGMSGADGWAMASAPADRTSPAAVGARDGGAEDAGRSPAPSDGREVPKAHEKKKKKKKKKKKETGKKRKKLVASHKGAADRGPGDGNAGQKAAVGFLTLDSRPWSEVWLSGKKLGLTPLAYKELPVGRHEVVLRNRKLGIEKRVWIQIQPGKTAVHVIDLKQ
ncbi:MAG: serine/threonine protein kinase [Deltaproteobacteria bacterium]|nr:serine/threonine protein kinase [Deltaproteobacteria bacterium]